MKHKLLKLSTLVLSLGVIAAVIPLTISKSNVNVIADKNYLYNTDFSTVTVTGQEGGRVNEVTGYIHANNFVDTKTVSHSGGQWLDYAISCPSQFYTLGWLGGGGGLTLLRAGETYTAELKIEITNMDYMYVEYRSDSYGAFMFKPDGTILDNAGPNMCDVSYNTSTKMLKFSFTALNFQLEGCPGYLQLVSYNATEGAKCYLQTVKIYHADHVMAGTFDEYKTGAIDVNNPDVFSKFYVEGAFTSTLATEIADVSGDRALKLTSSIKGGQFYINKLTMMNPGRSYTFTINYEANNLNWMYFFYGHKYDGMPYQTFAAFNIKDGLVHQVVDGAGCNFSASLDATNKIITVNFDYSTVIPKPYEFFIDLDGESSGYTLSLKKVQLDVKKYGVGIDVDTSGFNNVTTIGTPFNWADLVVTLNYSDESLKILSYPTEYTVSGVDINKVGLQAANVTSGNFTKIIEVEVTGTTSDIIIDTTNVKTNLDYGEDLDLTNLVVKVVFGDVIQEIGPCASTGGYSICYNTFNKYIPGDHRITVIYKQYEKDFTVHVADITDVTFDDIGYIGTGN